MRSHMELSYVLKSTGRIMVACMLLGCTAMADETPERNRPLTGKRPEFGYGFFEGKSIDELVKFWASDNPGLRNISALEVAKHVWKSDNPVATLKSLLPRMQKALKSDNPNERRAVADFVYGLRRAGGKYMVYRVRISDEKKVAGYAAMRKEMGVLLPTICKNVKDDPHVWARAGAVDLAGMIIPPYEKPADGLYEKYAKIVRPLLLVRAEDDDKFMKEAAGRALEAIGIGDLNPKLVIKTMGDLIDTQVNGTSWSAFRVLKTMDSKDLANAYDIMFDAMASDVNTKPAMIGAELLLKNRPPKTPAAIIKYLTRDQHGHNIRAQALYPEIRKFTDDELRSALPELRKFAVKEEYRGRRDVDGARRTIKKLEKKDKLKPAEKIALENARKLVANPPHEWVLKLFDRIGEPRPAVGKEVTGGNPERTAKLSTPPWIPKNVDGRVSLTKTDGLAGNRAMDVLPGKKGDLVPIDGRAFSTEEPETNCRYLSIQDAELNRALRRPLGPTGILGTFSSRRIFVVGTQPGSPSYEKILANDWIIGVNGHYFTAEPRIGMAWAIEESEGREDGSMTLKVLRDGKKMDVTINLQPLGRFVDTWPYGCGKSDKILDNLCKFTIRHNADWVIPGALLLLATGEDKYMPEVRRKVYELAEKGPGNSNWFTSYQLILMCEYYQKTGDANVLPAITAFAEHLTSGQTYFGGFLHNTSYYNSWRGASKIGYGEMNMAGAPSFVSLVMANECGVELNNTAFRKTIDYFKIFAGRGHVPYGAFPPYIEGAQTGGKTAIAGVGFDLLGRSDVAKPYVSMSGSAYEHMWTGYHGGSFWNAVWRPLCVARDSSASFKRLTRYNLWYFNLARHWNGGMTAPVRDEVDFGNNHNPTQVTSYGIIYALPRKGIRLTGAPRSVFTKIGELKMGRFKKLYDSRDDEALKKAIKDLRATARMTKETYEAYDDLLAAAEWRRKVEKMERGRLKATLDSKDFYTAGWMIDTMNKAGITVPEEQAKAMAEASTQELENGAAYWSIMPKLISGPTTFSPSDCKGLAKLARGKGFYAEKAKETMAYYAVPEDGNWNLNQMAVIEAIPKENVGRLFFLVSPSMDEIKTLRMKSWMTEVGAPHPVDDMKANPDLKGWYNLDYDDSKWPKTIGPFLIQERRGNEREGHVLQRYPFTTKQINEIDDLYLKARLGPRNFRGTLYLNGEALLEFRKSPSPRGRSRGQRRLGHETAYIKLPAVAKKLLREGRNVLALRADVPPNSSWSHAWVRMVDVGLGATKIGGGSWGYDPLVDGE